MLTFLPFEVNHQTVLYTLVTLHMLVTCVPLIICFFMKLMHFTV
jgi:hypothetical protein